jgi:hypothetical protein
MKAAWSRWLLACAGAALVWALGGCASLEHNELASSAAAGPAAAADSTQQILVMLRLPPPRFRPDANYAAAYDAQSGSIARRRVIDEIARTHGARVVGEWPMPALGVDCFVLALPDRASPDAIAGIIAGDVRVESAQPVKTFEALGHDDPLYPLQPAARQWHLAELHAVATGRNARVAQIDTGVELEHPDLRGQIALARNFVDGSDFVAETHGTAVAGIIAARADNGLGIAGIAPQVTLLALRACWQQSKERSAAVCNSFTLAKALQFALSRNVQIINLSVGGPRDRLLERLLDAALELGVTVVGAADARPGAAFPGSHPGVLQVAADDAPDMRAGVLLAPGRDIPATMPGGRWDFVTGSSYATAHVTGIVALLRELDPRLQAAGVRDAFEATVRRNPLSGAMFVDACRVIGRAARASVCEDTREANSAQHR